MSYNKRRSADRKRQKAKLKAKAERDALRAIIYAHAATADLVARLPASPQEARSKWHEGYRKRSVWVEAQAGAPGLGKPK